MSNRLEPVLVVSQLRVETLAGAEIVDEISFDVRRGEILALVGESGCGKTTIAMALLGHARLGTRIAGGAVVLEGHDLLALKPSALRAVRGSRISYVPQDPVAGLNPRHRVGEQIAETLLVHGATREHAAATVRDLTERVRLPADLEFLRRYPFELSGGQQQRVAIAMALACLPAVVVLDEPTTGLDVTTQASVLELVRELSRETSAAFVYVTHDLAVVDNLADVVAVLYAGRLVEHGSTSTILSTPAHPYASMLVGSVPRLSVRHQLSGIAGAAPPPEARPSGCFFEPRCPLAIEHCRTEFPNETVFDAPERRRVRCWRAGELTPPDNVIRQDAATPRMEIPLLEVRDVTASYGRGSRRSQVLHEISLSIGPRECLALVGESGSGKTTLGRCVAGLHPPDGGSILLSGGPLAPGAPDRQQSQRQAIQIVFQNPDRSLNPAENVRTTVGRVLGLFDLPATESEIVELLERVRLPTRYLDRYPRELSGGEKQRVAIARALAARPTLLVCDELTSALDVSIQAAVVTLLEELRMDGLALLFITHNLALVNSIADRVVVLQEGRIREMGATSDVVSAPKDSYTRELLAAAPEIGGRR